MDFELNPELRGLRARVRAFLADAWPVERRRYAMNDSIARDIAAAHPSLPGVDDQVVSAFYRELGRAGLLRIGFPERWGGTGGGPMARYVVQWEVASAGAPFPNTSIGIVAPTLLEFGSDELVEAFLPPIMEGRCEFALGYTEPEAGTDLAGLRTRAARVDDSYVIRGQKIFSSAAHYSEYYWVAARTDPEAPKHRGISLFIVPMESDGITVTPLHTMSGIRTNIVFLDDVTIPARNLVGAENEGWRYLTHALAGERYTAISPAPVIQALKGLFQGLRDVWGDHGERAGGFTTSHRGELSRLRADTRVAALLSARTAWLTHQGRPTVAEAAETKLWITELRHRLSRHALEMLGPASLLQEGHPDAVGEGQLERMYRHSFITLFTAGANDVQRDLIARVGLGLPRS